MTGYFIAGANSTGAPLTLNVNSLGARNVYLNGSATSATNVVFSGLIYPFYYDGTEVQLAAPGPAPVTSFSLPGAMSGGSNGAIAQATNQAYILGYYYFPPATFGHIYLNITTDDATHAYSWGLYTTSGTGVCTTTAGDLTAIGITSGTLSACSQGTIFWPGGNLIFVGGGAATTAQIGTSYGSQMLPFSTNAITGTLTGGQVPTSITVPSAGQVDAPTPQIGGLLQ
jgi:hypothetical protein